MKDAIESHLFGNALSPVLINHGKLISQAQILLEEYFELCIQSAFQQCYNCIHQLADRTEIAESFQLNSNSKTSNERKGNLLG
jgi:hypothetical protein